MAVLTKNHGLFLHVPKTGGNWVTGVLEQNNLIARILPEKHDTLELLSLKYPDLKLNAESRFCFIRNPFDWYTSWYFYETAKDWKEWGLNKWHPCAQLNKITGKDFASFIKKVTALRPGYLTRLYNQYCSSCTYIGRHEKLAFDLQAYLNIEGMKTIPPQNVSAKSEIVWTTELKQLIINSEAEVFKKYYPEPCHGI